MRKLLTVTILVFIILSCHMFNGNTTVINSSSYAISFNWGGKAVMLNQGEKASIDYSYVQIENLKPEKRVKLNYINENNRDIVDLPSYEVRVENITPDSITLRAGGWLEKDMVNVISGYFKNDISQIGLIYTRAPKFTVDIKDFPIKVEYRFVDDVCYVKIY